ncbi:MAG: hypothetical protein M1839_001685 [Geoglossum umbratile]|nr:MAG: hypothetical protein M1839_001685 [Geoglossum umbratile]
MDTDSLFSLRTSTAIAGVACLLYVVCRSIYRLYLSPIAKFPGPKLAALTYWYEIYYDVIKGGMYIWEIEKMHKKYGPIIRINPHELHVNDPSFLETLFSRTSPRDKFLRHTRTMGIQDSTFGTTSHALHRLRRGAINPFFSKRMVTVLEPVIQSKVEMLCSRIAEFKGKPVPVPIKLAYASLTTDVITEYALRRSYGHLEDKDFAPLWCKTIRSASRVMHLGKHFPWLYHVLKRMPDWFVEFASPGFSMLLRFHKETREQIQQIMDNPNDVSYSSKSQPTIFHELLCSDLPAKEKSFDRLCTEGITIVSAGAETTAATLGVITFFLLDNPEILKKLKKELEVAMPDLEKPAKWRELEQLPYLTLYLPAANFAPQYSEYHLEQQKRTPQSGKVNKQHQQARLPPSGALQPHLAIEL